MILTKTSEWKIARYLIEQMVSHVKGKPGPNGCENSS